MAPFNNSSTAARSPKPLIDPAKGGPVDVVSSVILLIDEMVTIMNDENALIEQRKLKEHAELLKRKQRLTVDYRASLKSIALQPELLKRVPDELRARAKLAATKLAEASDRNARILRTAIMATQNLIQTIVGMVKEEVLPQNTYSNPFAGRQLKGAYSPTCKPVTASRTA